MRSGKLGTNYLVYQTRNTGNNIYRLPKVRKLVFKHSFEYIDPTYVNKLPVSFKKNESLKLFCEELKNWLFKHSNHQF